MAIKVPQDVYEGLEEVRTSGVVNMFDWRAVQYYASQWDYYATVVWLEDNSTLYIRGVSGGIEPEEVS